MVSLEVRGADNWIVLEAGGTVQERLITSQDQAVVVLTGDGDDQILLSGLMIPAIVSAGTGNDTIRTGVADDQVADGLGNDSLDDLGGGNVFLSGSGTDSVQAISATDQLIGYDNDDIVAAHPDAHQIDRHELQRSTKTLQLDDLPSVDFNGDSYRDVLIDHGTHVSISAMSAGQSIQTSVPLLFPDSGYVLADQNSDGRDELLSNARKISVGESMPLG